MASLVDCSSLTKILIRAAPESGDHLGVPFGLSTRDSDGALVAGYGYDEWLVLAAPGSAADTAERHAAAPGDGFRSVIDMTHGRAAFRLTGATAAEVLARLCPIDLSDDMAPTGAVRRCQVGGLDVGLIRDDIDGERSYLLVVDCSYRQSMHEMLLDAGAEFGLT